ncbi:alpha/beta fold hydrolase [Hymenobacter sp. NST-14]|uniref:alpha/beta fold hydrolase n=1 Tax=Hymenobacter piscis TaxID=2839984 RepID=UPI001C00D654|nr:alpha/beta fold hydrolase [Hymenobacter piscis]MBT9394204.1 alpha/beta fold hydrolase [Hymenobacter piscis]
MATLRTFFLLAGAGLLSGRALGQHFVVQGRAVDARQQPVPFATVGVPGTGRGTAADEQGNFRLQLPDSLRPASLVLSAVGFAPTTTPLAAFGPAPLLVQLPERAVSLREVVIRPGQSEPAVVLGRPRKANRLTTDLYNAYNLIGAGGPRQVGTVLPISQACELQDFSFQVAFNTFRQVEAVLHLYRTAQGRPTEALVRGGIPVVVSQKRGWVNVDLREYRLRLPAGQAVAATLHWQPNDSTDVSRQGFVLAARTGRRQQRLTRSAPAAPWQLTSGDAPVCYLTAAGTAPPPPDSAPDEPSPLFRLMRAARFPPRSSHHYGDSTALGRTVPVAGARLYYETYGQGEPLLLLHGNGQSIAAWHRQIAALARHFRVLAVDTRGHGRSLDETSAELTYGLLAEDVRQLLDALQLRRVRVLGWSDGANTALHLARQAPDYVSALVLVGANLSPEALDPPLLTFLQQQLAPLPPTSAAARWHRLLLQEPHLRPTDLTGLRVPTLVLAGQHDVILEAHTRALAAALPGARLHIFPGASHFVPHEQPQDFNARVLAFLGVPRP